MAKIVKALQTLRNHWKKSTFFAVLGYYGINYSIERRRTYLKMKSYCEKAVIDGYKPLPMGAQNKHITVLLNPVSGNRKGRETLEKWSEPLLHIAGFLVNVVRTERMSEARDLAQIIDKTNIIAVGGGDGTLFEMVSGLLRREDASEAVRRFVVGIIPMGSKNEFARRLFKVEKNISEQEFMTEASMAIVKHRAVPQDVMKIQILKEEEISGVPGQSDAGQTPEKESTVKKAKDYKPWYSMTGIKVGQFRELGVFKDGMMSFLGENFNTFWSLLRTPTHELFKAEIQYTPACLGCSKCTEKTIMPPKPSRSISSILFSPFRKSTRQESNDTVKEVILVDNPECGQWQSVCVSTPEFNVRTAGSGHLVMEIGPQYSFTELFSEAFNRIHGHPSKYSQTIKFNEAKIIPVSSPEHCSIDSEEFDMMPVHVKLLRKKVYFFSP